MSDISIPLCVCSCTSQALSAANSAKCFKMLQDNCPTEQLWVPSISEEAPMSQVGNTPTALAQLLQRIQCKNYQNAAVLVKRASIKEDGSILVGLMNPTLAHIRQSNERQSTSSCYTAQKQYPAQWFLPCPKVISPRKAPFDVLES